jgi:hypothetical protein
MVTDIKTVGGAHPERQLQLNVEPANEFSILSPQLSDASKEKSPHQKSPQKSFRSVGKQKIFANLWSMWNIHRNYHYLSGGDNQCVEKDGFC